MMMLRSDRHGRPMSTTYVNISITNLFTNNTTTVRMLVDTGCMLSTVTDEVAQATLLANPERVISLEQQAALQGLIRRRLRPWP